MGRIAVLGEDARVRGFALAGALVRPADGPREVAEAWNTLPADVRVVILTPRAAEHLKSAHLEHERLTVVMPP
ncbi:V-type ATP synthase subunit F [Actinomadura miaoliensis]|uniref:ATP synthase subunit F n=1 Tax=Actinomadura miaoliensis TaxID=430685 RepID=A0ABP7VZ69_9ACTN